MEDLKIWEQYTVTLNKDSKVGFGIAVSGGWDKPNPSSGDPAVIISDVVRGGPAMGRLQTLDHIVMVNGVSMEKATSTYAIQHLKNCGRTANITVKRPRTIQVPVSAPRGVSQNSSRSEDLSLRRDAPSDFDKGYPAPRRGSQGERAPRPPSDLDSGSERSYDRSPSNSAPKRWSPTPSPAPERNGDVLPLMSGYKSLPKYEDPYKPIKAVLVKKDPKEEFGLKLGSQIFVKYMTPTGLASREGTLQEGDIILKINGIVTENLSLEDTKRLVARSASKLSMTVLRDDRQFLVCIPELQDSDVASSASSELEDISDIESELTLPPPQKKDLQASRGQHSERIRAEPMQPDLRAAQYPDWTDHRRGVSTAGRRANGDNSDPDSDRTPSPSPPRKKAIQNSRGQHRDRTRAEPVQSASDSDSASLPRVLPAVMRRPAEEDSDLDSDHTPSPAQKDSRDSRGQHRDRKRPTSKQSDVREARDADRANFPRWRRPTEDFLDPGAEPALSEHTASLPREIHSQDSRGQYRERVRPQSAHDSDRDSLPRVLPVPSMRPPPDHSDLDSERTPSPPRRDDSLDSREKFNGRLPPAPNGKMLAGVELKEAPAVYAAKEEEPIYCLPPESPPRQRAEPREEPNLGYSSDLKRIGFVKEDSVGLRLTGGNDVGIFVGGVKPGSLASQQGIEEGDQILKVNGVDFGSFTREEAALYLLQIPKGEQVIIQAQSKLDIYRKMLQSNVGDSFYIRTHFDHEGEGPGTLSFTRGDVFRVLDTMHRGKLGTWRAVRMSNILQEADRGTIPNKSRAEQLASTELTQRSSSSSTPSSRLRAEFWKLRGLRGAKKSNRKSREDLSQLTIQGKFPPYEKVFLREATFKRPIVILGPLSDVAIQKLSTEMPAEFQTALMVPRNSEEGSSSVIKLETVRQISEQDRHPLLDITPSAVERLNYIQYHPMVLFLDPESRQDVKTMRQQLCPQSNKSSRRLYTQAVKMRKYCPHLFSARIPLLPDSNVWFEILKDCIKELQARPVWFSEDKAESGEEEDLDALSRSRSTDYLSCDSRATSDYEDTDGEACTDNELDEAFEGPALGRSSEPALPQYSEPALARSSEPAWEEEDSSHKPYRTHSYSAEPRVWVHAPEADRLTPELESAPPDLREVPDHRGVPDHPKQPSFSQPQGQQQRLFGGAIDHQAVLWRRPQIRGSMSSEEDEEDKDFDWGPATDL